MMGHMGWGQERANENPAIFPVASTWAHPGASSYHLVSAASFQCRDFEECLGKNWEAHIGNHSYGPMVDYVPMELVTYIGGMQLISPIA